MCTNYDKNFKINYFDFLKLNDNEKKKNINNNGLNTLEYKILERKILCSIVELIKVDF